MNAAVIPDGTPASVKATVPVKPANGVSVAVKLALPPGRIAWEDGVAEIEKSDTVTVRVAA